VTTIAHAIERLRLAPHDPHADQAIIDLLHLVMLADRLSSADERDRINTFVVSRKWPAGHNPESYALNSLGAARATLADSDRLHEALDAIVSRLSDSPSRAYAVELCRDLAAIDGLVAPTERALIDYVQLRLTSTAA
jgi:hypothetical protein